MAIHPEHHDHMHDEVDTVSAVTTPFGISQIISVVLGIVFIVLGAVGLARAGLDSMTRPITHVGVFTMTPLLGSIHLALGLLLLAGAADRAAARGIGMVIGALMIAGGIIAIIQPVRSFGWNDANGVLYLLGGVLLMIGAILTPPAVVHRTGVIGTHI